MRAASAFPSRIFAAMPVAYPMIRLPDAPAEGWTDGGAKTRERHGTAVAPSLAMKRLLVLSLLLCSPPARASELVLAGRIDRVVAAGDLVAVVRDGEVRVLSADGRPLVRLAAEGPPEPGAVRADTEDDVLEEYGISEEERESEYAEQVLDDEAGLHDRRAARAGVDRGAARPPLLAASATEIWIAMDLRLWRVDAGGRAQRVSTLARRFDHLAAGPDGRL